MKILFWTDGFWPGFGGLEVFCVNLIRALKERGHACEVITNSGEETSPYFFEEVAVHPFPFQKTLERGQLRTIADQCETCHSIVERFQPDVIHQHGINRSIFHFTRRQKRARRPAVVTLHDNLLEPKKQAMAAWTLANAEQVVAVSDFIYRQTLAREPGLAGRLRTIRNALPGPSLPPAPLPANRVLTIGRLLSHKGFDLAIEAFARVATEFPDATLTLAGDGEDRGALEQMAGATGLGEQIRFAGWIAPGQIPALINAHSLVVVPSRWQEPFGLVALEAAQFGRPVIASRSGGLPEIVVDGVTGKLFENDNLAALTDALRGLLADPALATRLGRDAHAHATSHFPFNRLVDDYEEVYRRALTKQPVTTIP